MVRFGRSQGPPSQGSSAHSSRDPNQLRSRGRLQNPDSGGLFRDQYLIAAFFLSFILVCMKKWEPGGNLDTIWYSAIAKNIAQTGDYFHFFISRHWQSQVYDHMPMTYWITGSLMRLFGISDFVARLYPMASSLTSCMLVYLIASRIQDKHFGLVALICYGLTTGASKWNGALLHDVPLTMFVLTCVYSFMRARQDSRWLYLTATCFALGILTKGPIIGGFALAVFISATIERNWFFIKTPHFIGSLIIIALILGSLFLPELSFDGESYYSHFLKEKLSYTAGITSGWTWYFAYLDDIKTATFLMIPFYLLAIPSLFAKSASQRLSFGLDFEARRLLRFVLVLCLSIIVPLSLFQIKFPHYLLPAYPEMSILAAVPISYWLRRYSAFLPTFIKRLSIAAICIFVMFPIKTTGQRDKEDINFANAIKLDTQLATKEVIFVGDYADDMIISQTYKFYGSIDLKHAAKSEVGAVDLAKTWLIIPVAELPLKLADRELKDSACVLRNERYCAVTEKSGLTLKIPTNKFPYELYGPPM